MDNRKELALRSTRFKFQVNWLVLGNNGGQSTKLASRGLSSRILPLQDSWTRTLQALQFLALPDFEKLRSWEAQTSSCLSRGPVT